MSTHIKNALLGVVLVFGLGVGCGGDGDATDAGMGVANTPGDGGTSTLSDGGASASGDAATGSGSGSAAAGATAVATRSCGTCHTGSKGLLAGRDMPITGPNITPDNTTGIGLWTQDQIVKAILTGVDEKGKPLCATMYRYGTMGMLESEARDIAAYLKSIPAVNSGGPKPTCQ